MVCSSEQSRINGTKSKGAVTARGKAIASRNATKHGLLAKQPPLLASEDLETFQGLLQSLVDEYEPLGAIEWCLVQTIAMCIQRQHRLWGAEAALGNAQLLPPVSSSLTAQKYPTHKQPEHNEHWSHYHPVNLAKEKKLLRWYCDRHPQRYYPTERRSKYFADIWQEWIDSTIRDLERVKDEYPTDGIPGKPDSVLAIANAEQYSNRFFDWIRDLYQEEHPYAEIHFYYASLKAADVPKSKDSWEYYRACHTLALDKFQKRIERIEQIEEDIEQEKERYQQELAAYREQTTSPISQQVLLLSRYESHIAKQLKEAIDQLQSLQSQRKTKGSIGSFGKIPQ
jgi:hypothetical protein